MALPQGIESGCIFLVLAFELVNGSFGVTGEVASYVIRRSQVQKVGTSCRNAR